MFRSSLNHFFELSFVTCNLKKNRNKRDFIFLMNDDAIFFLRFKCTIMALLFFIANYFSFPATSDAQKKHASTSISISHYENKSIAYGHM